MFDPRYFFKTWDMFTDMKSFRHTMDKENAWDAYSSLIDEQADYLHAQMNNEAVAANNKAWLTEWLAVKEAHDPGLAHELLLAGLLLFVPLEEKDDSHDSQFSVTSQTQSQVPPPLGVPLAADEAVAAPPLPRSLFEEFFDRPNQALIKRVSEPMGGTILYQKQQKQRARRKSISFFSFFFFTL